MTCNVGIDKSGTQFECPSEYRQSSDFNTRICTFGYCDKSECCERVTASLYVRQILPPKNALHPRTAVKLFLVASFWHVFPGLVTHAMPPTPNGILENLLVIIKYHATSDINWEAGKCINKQYLHSVTTLLCYFPFTVCCKQYIYALYTCRMKEYNARLCDAS